MAVCVCAARSSPPRPREPIKFDGDAHALAPSRRNARAVPTAAPTAAGAAQLGEHRCRTGTAGAGPCQLGASAGLAAVRQDTAHPQPVPARWHRRPAGTADRCAAVAADRCGGGGGQPSGRLDPDRGQRTQACCARWLHRALHRHWHHQPAAASVRKITGRPLQRLHAAGTVCLQPAGADHPAVAAGQDGQGAGGVRPRQSRQDELRLVWQWLLPAHRERTAQGQHRHRDDPCTVQGWRRCRPRGDVG